MLGEPGHKSDGTTVRALPQGVVDRWTGSGKNRRAVARATLACRCALAVLLMAFVAACSETTSSNAALTTTALTTAGPASGPTLAFDSIDGPPVAVFNRLVDNLTSEAQARQLSIASREGAANYRVRGYPRRPGGARPHTRFVGVGRL